MGQGGGGGGGGKAQVVRPIDGKERAKVRR